MIVQTLLLITFVRITDSSCRAHVCLSWKITNGNITLICKTDSLFYSVSFNRSVEREIAFCASTSCHSTLHESHITQNKTTNQTVLTISMAKQLNGWWSCKYGETNGKADVEVTLVETLFPNTNNTNKDMTEKRSNNSSCIESTVPWTMLSFAASYMLSRICVFFLAIPYYKEIEQTICNAGKLLEKLNFCHCCEDKFLFLSKNVAVFIMFGILFMVSLCLGMIVEEECTESSQFAVSVVIAVPIGMFCCSLFLIKDTFEPVAQQSQNEAEMEMIPDCLVPNDESD